MVQGRILPLPRSIPEIQGIPSQAILSFVDAAESSKANLHSFMLLRHGCVIAQGWWQPYSPSCRRYLYSLSKSFTSSAVGFAVNEGKLTLEDRVISFFPEDLPETISPNLAAMRVRDLLTMTSGHAMDSIIPLLMYEGENWVNAILSYPVDYLPGTHFVYDSGASYLLSAIIQKVTGKSALDYLTPRLFEPLGITEVAWDICPQGINTGGWGLSLTTEEIAKFGLLYLRNGIWNGDRLLPREWIAESTRKQVENNTADRENENPDWRQGYGFQFWRCQHNAYRADGAFGQYCIVMPDQDAVLVITSETSNMQTALDAAWKYLLPAMGSAAIPEDPQAQAALQYKVDSLKIPAPPAGPQPDTIQQVSGLRFLLDPNPDCLGAVTLCFTPDTSTLLLESEGGAYTIRAGNGTWVENQSALPILHPNMMGMLFNQPVQCTLRFAATGSWKDPQTYILTLRYLETPHSETITCQFLDGGIHIEFSSSIKDPNNPFLQGKEKVYKARIT